MGVLLTAVLHLGTIPLVCPTDNDTRPAACARRPAGVEAPCGGATRWLVAASPPLKLGICTHRLSLAVSRRSASVSLPPACARTHVTPHYFSFFLKGHGTREPACAGRRNAQGRWLQCTQTHKLWVSLPANTFIIMCTFLLF